LQIIKAFAPPVSELCIFNSESIHTAKKAAREDRKYAKHLQEMRQLRVAEGNVGLLRNERRKHASKRRQAQIDVLRLFESFGVAVCLGLRQAFGARQVHHVQ
jgi:hypothetical protein